VKAIRCSPLKPMTICRSPRIASNKNHAHRSASSIQTSSRLTRTYVEEHCGVTGRRSMTRRCDLTPRTISMIAEIAFEKLIRFNDLCIILEATGCGAALIYEGVSFTPAAAPGSPRKGLKN
jgi:hypothetical protein